MEKDIENEAFSTDPVVSVCVQTYQHSKYIKQCLDSILMQETTFPFEIILGEDCSADGTREICKSYAKKFPGKIKLFLRNREDVIYINGVPTGRYNLMQNLYSSSGKYIAICEGDDYWLDPLKLQLQLDFLESNSDYAISFHNAFIQKGIDEIKDNKLFIKGSKYKDTYNLEDTFGRWFIPTASLFYRKPVQFEFPTWFQYIPNADSALISIMAQFGKIKYIDKPMSVYRIHNQGLGSRYDFFFLNRSKVFLLESLNLYYNKKFENEINKELKRRYNIMALQLLLQPWGLISVALERLKTIFSKDQF